MKGSDVRTSRSVDLAVIPGDGIGQEVVAEGLKVLSAVLPQDVKPATEDYDFGARRYHATGETLTEPVHGSAPDIAGQGKADPTATVLSVALLLRHLGYEAEAARIDEAVAADLSERTGKPARSTSETGDALAARLAG